MYTHTYMSAAREPGLRYPLDTTKNLLPLLLLLPPVSHPSFGVLVLFIYYPVHTGTPVLGQQGPTVHGVSTLGEHAHVQHAHAHEERREDHLGYGSDSGSGWESTSCRAQITLCDTFLVGF